MGCETKGADTATSDRGAFTSDRPGNQGPGGGLGPGGEETAHTGGTEETDDTDSTAATDDTALTTETTETTEDEGVSPPDLSTVTWLHTNVSGWSETATLSSVTASGSDICMSYDKAGTWPIEVVYDTDVVGNAWVFIYWEERWYAGTFEWLRPDQTCKAMSSVAGHHIKQSPFDEASGWEPTSGETYYFMISGLARSSDRNVEERTGLMPFVWP